VKWEFHPYADLFPMMNPLELDALTEDIKENGQRFAIVRYQGKILDGRNRLKACEQADVEPRFEDFEGDDAAAHAYVLSVNAGRRDMTDAQRAMTAARIWVQNGDTKKRGPKKKGELVNGLPIDLRQLERLFRTTRPSMVACRDLLESAPDLAEMVSNNHRSIKEACKELERRIDQAEQDAENARRASKYAEKISQGEMTLEEAIQLALKEEQEERERQENLAASRRTWLSGLEECCRWLETYVAKDSDTYLTSITRPGSPGLEEHSLTRKRLEEAVKQINRLLKTAFGGHRHEPKEE